MTEQRQSRVVIVGGGPAGLTAAIYAARARLDPIVIEGFEAGGQLMTTSEVENFPGFPEGIKGAELIASLRRQAERFGASYLTQDLTEAELSTRPFKLKVGAETILAQTLIIATGASARYLDLPSVLKLKGRGVSACATCDGFFFRNKQVCLVGGGDSALEEARFLTQFASRVTVIHRRDEFRASKIMQEYARANPKIEFLLSHVVEEALGEERLVGLKLRDLKTNEVKEIATEGLFFAIGHNPNTALFKPWLKTDEAGYLIREPDRTATAVAGVFAAGDVADSYYRQATTAAADGCRAALEVERFLMSQGEL